MASLCQMFQQEDHVRHTVCGLMMLMLMSAGVATQDQAAIARGAKVYAAQKCSMCHSVAGKGNPKGPLDNAGRLSEEDLRQWMISPRVMAEKAKSTRKPLMPEYTKLSKEELEAVIAYLRTLTKP
ncbi:MAG TPA: cytochrome c [Vicinamibacterales bacterium]|nr:cytochrome c [Vicinamibacterales bacterium]